MDGLKQRVVRGDTENFMRPAILERDTGIPRTDYTRYACYLFTCAQRLFSGGSRWLKYFNGM
jgi:hypothetical protein